MRSITWSDGRYILFHIYGAYTNFLSNKSAFVNETLMQHDKIKTPASVDNSHTVYGRILLTSTASSIVDPLSTVFDRPCP